MKRLFYIATLAVPLLCGIDTAKGRISFDSIKAGEHPIPEKYWILVIECPKQYITTVSLNAITSVSKHTYSVDGIAFREITIDTLGNNSIRIYACLNERVKTTKDRLSNTRALLDSKSGNVSKLPAKKFPEGTYSHNVEYLIEMNSVDESKVVLNELYESVVNALIKKEGCTYKICTSS